MAYKCSRCNKIYKKKGDYNRHINRKYPCTDMNKSGDIIKLKDTDRKINSETYIKYLNEKKCVYCEMEFSSKSNVVKHIKSNCKKIKESENEKEKIFNKKYKELMNEHLELKKTTNNEIKKLKQRLMKFEKTDKKKIINNNTTNDNSNNNSNNVNNIDNTMNTNNINQNVMLTGYGKEDMSKLPEKEILYAIKRVHYGPSELTRLTHFNHEHPEYHNIYIPKMNEKYGMAYNDVENDWQLLNKDTLIEKIYTDKKNWIEENLEDFLGSLSEQKKIALQRWLDMEETNENTKDVKEEIKLLLYNKRKMAMDQKKKMLLNKKK